MQAKYLVAVNPLKGTFGRTGRWLEYEPDVVWIGNRDGRAPDRHPVIRWGIEKNRRRPSDVEFRHLYHGASYSFDLLGEPVPEEESWQAERARFDSRDLTSEER